MLRQHGQTLLFGFLEAQRHRIQEALGESYSNSVSRSIFDEDPLSYQSPIAVGRSSFPYVYIYHTTTAPTTTATTTTTTNTTTTVITSTSLLLVYFSLPL